MTLRAKLKRFYPILDPEGPTRPKNRSGRFQIGFIKYIIRLNPNLKPFLRSTRPNWTRFWILRANLTGLNPKIGPKIGLNPKNRVGFGRASLHSGSHKSLSLGRSHKSLRFVIYCVAYWAERLISLFFYK